MSEWFKEHAWKACIGRKLIAGSNPALSAEKKARFRLGFFIVYQIVNIFGFRYDWGVLALF